MINTEVWPLLWFLPGCLQLVLWCLFGLQMLPCLIYLFIKHEKNALQSSGHIALKHSTPPSLNLFNCTYILFIRLILIDSSISLSFHIFCDIITYFIWSSLFYFMIFFFFFILQCIWYTKFLCYIKHLITFTFYSYI